MIIEVNPHAFTRIPSTGTYICLSRARHSGGSEISNQYSVLDKLRIAQKAGLRLPTSGELSEAEKYLIEVGDNPLPRQNRKAPEATGREMYSRLKRFPKATSTFLAVRKDGEFPAEATEMLDNIGFSGEAALIERPHIMSQPVTRESHCRPCGNSYVLVNNGRTRITDMTGRIPMGTGTPEGRLAIYDCSGSHDDSLGTIVLGGDSPEDVARAIESGSMPALGQSNWLYVDGLISVTRTGTFRVHPAHGSFRGVSPELLRSSRYVDISLYTSSSLDDSFIHFASDEDPMFWAERYEGGKGIDLGFVYQRSPEFGRLTLEKAAEEIAEREAWDRKFRGEAEPDTLPVEITS